MSAIFRTTLFNSFIAINFLGISCTDNGKKSDTNVNVAGGHEDDTKFLEVIGLKTFADNVDKSAAGTCTGTIVRDDLVLTANHCVSDVAKVIVWDRVGTPFSNKKLSSSYFLTFPTEPGKWQHDLAFVVFPKGSFAGHSIGKIARKTAKIGDLVYLIGYGLTDTLICQNGLLKNLFFEAKRYMGINRVAEIDNFYLYITEFVGNEKLASTRRGDSGSPLLNEFGEITGILFGAHNKKYKIYNRVDAPQIAEFINSVLNGSPEAWTLQRLKMDDYWKHMNIFTKKYLNSNTSVFKEQDTEVTLNYPKSLQPSNIDKNVLKGTSYWSLSIRNKIQFKDGAVIYFKKDRNRGGEDIFIDFGSFRYAFSGDTEPNLVGRMLQDENFLKGIDYLKEAAMISNNNEFTNVVLQLVALLGDNYTSNLTPLYKLPDTKRKILKGTDAQGN